MPNGNNEYDTKGIANRYLEILKYEAQVYAFLQVIKDRYGLSDEEIRAMVDDLKWIKKHRKINTGAIGWTIKSVAAFLLIATWEGIKHFLGVSNG